MPAGLPEGDRKARQKEGKVRQEQYRHTYKGETLGVMIKWSGCLPQKKKQPKIIRLIF